MVGMHTLFPEIPLGLTIGATAIGIPLGVGAWLANEILGWLSLQYLYACGFMFAVSVGLCVLGSLLTPPPEIHAQEVWRAQLAQPAAIGTPNTPWYTDYRWLSLGLLLLTAAIVLWWW